MKKVEGIPWASHYEAQGYRHEESSIFRETIPRTVVNNHTDVEALEDGDSRDSIRHWASQASRSFDSSEIVKDQSMRSTGSESQTIHQSKEPHVPRQRASPFSQSSMSLSPMTVAFEFESPASDKRRNRTKPCKESDERKSMGGAIRAPLEVLI